MKKGVLFVCFGNACRSIMAEALARHYWEDTLEAASAGVSALGYVPNETKKVLDEIGVSSKELYSKGFEEIDIERMQLVINLAAYPLESLLPASFGGKLIHWHVRDPYQESRDSFRKTRDAIEGMVAEKLPTWLDDA